MNLQTYIVSDGSFEAEHYRIPRDLDAGCATKIAGELCLIDSSRHLMIRSSDLLFRRF